MCVDNDLIPRGFTFLHSVNTSVRTLSVTGPFFSGVSISKRTCNEAAKHSRWCAGWPGFAYWADQEL